MKYTDFTEKEIEVYLNDFKDLTRQGRHTISRNGNRQENIDFMEDYNISDQKAKEILLSLEVLDFCYVVDNEKEMFAHEKLYVFCRAFDLDNRGELENIDIYIKSNLMETRGGNKRLVVISFHKRNKEITYCFK
ncbi:hypothetical protein [Radiobacillus sp. PE A8.2]|uniref:hypothetical protein n=1 Tax=Radiobacillus sp. PE A8.2 TaxID=3380349 RepID=UPI00388EE88D